MNPKQPDNFRDRLIAQQQSDESLRRRYEQQLDSAFERPMTAPERIKDCINVAASLGFIVLFTYAATMRTDFSVEKRSISAALIAASALFGAFKLRRLLRGTINVRFDRRAKKWVWIGEMIVAALLMFRLYVKAPDTTHTIIVLLSLILVGVVVCAVQMRMLLAKLQWKCEEQNLELRYRIAQLSEQISKPR
jgi:hypothetical protein